MENQNKGNQVLPPPIPKVKKKKKISKWWYLLIGYLLLSSFVTCIGFMHRDKEEETSNVDMTAEDFKKSFESINSINEKLSDQVIAGELPKDKSQKGFLLLSKDKYCTFWTKPLEGGLAEYQHVGDGCWTIQEGQEGPRVYFYLISNETMCYGTLSSDSLNLIDLTKDKLTYIPKFANADEKAELAVALTLHEMNKTSHH